MRYIYSFIALVFIIVFSFCSSEKETVNHKDTIVRASKRLTEKA